MRGFINVEVTMLEAERQAKKALAQSEAEKKTVEEEKARIEEDMKATQRIRFETPCEQAVISITLLVSHLCFGQRLLSLRIHHTPLNNVGTGCNRTKDDGEQCCDDGLLHVFSY